MPPAYISSFYKRKDNYIKDATSWRPRCYLAVFAELRAEQELGTVPARAPNSSLVAGGANRGLQVSSGERLLPLHSLTVRDAGRLSLTSVPASQRGR